MIRKLSWLMGLVVAFVAVAAVGLKADILILRNGDRVQGQVVAVRGGEVEFREERGYNTRTFRVDLREVRRIEFDDDYRDDRGEYRGYRPPSDNRPGGGRGASRSGMRERAVVVDANRAWTDSGLDVRDGDRVYFSGVGEITWGPGRKDGPQGEKNSPFNPGRPIPNRPGASMIGKVGERGDPFFIGDSTDVFRMRGSGRLFIGVNDDDLRDNRGNWRVTVYY